MPSERTGPNRAMTAGFLRNYDLVSLRLLMSAIESGNLAKVAAQENISLSSVSRRISEFEMRVGVRLLQRHDRGVSPTDAALSNLHRLRGIFDLIDQMAEDFDAISAGHRGVVRVRAHLTAITGVLPERIAQFTADHPGIDIIVDEATSQDIVHAVAAGGCELGLVSGTVATAPLESFRWMSDELVVILPLGHPLEAHDNLSFEALLDQSFIGLAPTSALQTLFRGQAAVLGKGLREVARVSTFEGVREMVAAGMGISILPSTVVTGSSASRFGQLPRYTIRRLEEPWAARPLVICVRDRASLSASARTFLDYLLECA